MTSRRSLSRWRPVDATGEHARALSCLAQAYALHGLRRPPDGQQDDPSEWAVMPQRYAPFWCWTCGEHWFVRRHYEAHSCNAQSKYPAEKD
jgi:hypothetical protein